MLDGMEGVERASARDPEADRIGGRSADYHRRVDTAFRTIAATEPDRVRLINASGSPENVTAKLVEAIADGHGQIFIMARAAGGVRRGACGANVRRPFTGHQSEVRRECRAALYGPPI